MALGWRSYYPRYTLNGKLPRISLISTIEIGTSKLTDEAILRDKSKPAKFSGSQNQATNLKFKHS